jgi:hypothetical protein
MLTDEQRKSVWWAILTAEKDEPDPGSLAHRRAQDLRAILDASAVSTSLNDAALDELFNLALRSTCSRERFKTRAKELLVGAAPAEGQEWVDERAPDGLCTDSLCCFAWIGPHGHNLPRAAVTAPTMSEAARDRMRQLERALVYVGHMLHRTPQYQLCEGVNLIDGDRIRVKINGIDVEACDPIDRAAAKGESDEQ